MDLDCSKMPADQIYALMIQTVIPRPIAWVLSDNGNKTYNLAPFSFFNAVASNPPVLMISVGWKDEQTRKDTWVNIQERGHFVVHIPPADLAETMVATAGTLEHGVSEIDRFKIPLDHTADWPLPMVKGVKVAFFCSKYAIQEIGDDHQQGMILGEIKHMWLDDDIVQKKANRMTIDPLKINPIARLGGQNYAVIKDVLTIKRPQ